MDIKVICKYLFSWVARKQELDQRNCFFKKLKSFLSHIWTEYGYLIEISVFSPNTGRYIPEKTLNLDTFYAVKFGHFKYYWLF